ncbi:hypothetical protein QZH41_011305, partial [Actinostola sp. cb2023]
LPPVKPLCTKLYCAQNCWIGPTMKQIPRPVPDHAALPEFHYKIVHATPLTDSDGNERVPDDWQPRCNIKKLFEQKKLSIDDTDAIQEFSQKFIVNETYVKTYIEHLSTIFITEKLREILTDANHESHFPREGLLECPASPRAFIRGIQRAWLEFLVMRRGGGGEEEEEEERRGGGGGGGGGEEERRRGGGEEERRRRGGEEERRRGGGPYIDPTSTSHRPLIDPTSTPHRPHIDLSSTSHRPYIDPTSTSHRPDEPSLRAEPKIRAYEPSLRADSPRQDLEL